MGELMTAEEWDTHWYRIYDDARAHFGDTEAREIANGETVQQFGLRPEEAA